MINPFIMLLVWNLVVLAVYGIDKFLAKRGGRRISEATLLVLTLCLGAFGAMFGMVLWNHKTSKPKFRFLVPLLALLNGVFLWFVSK